MVSEKIDKTAGEFVEMKKVYVCSPLSSDDPEKMISNGERALMYCRFVYDQGCNPFAPHTYYPLFLDEECKKERAAGLKMAMEWMWAFQELWVFGETISDGMREEIEMAKLLSIKVKYFYEDMEEIKIERRYI